MGMNVTEHFGLWLVGLIIVSLVAFMAYPTLRRLIVGPDHRDLQRRRRNYGRVVSRAKRPMVMLSVKTGRR
jgi:hypothetical protein